VASTTKVLERLDAQYEVREVPMGKVYRWRPESVVVECGECGENQTLSASRHACEECGADHRPVVEQVLDPRPEYENKYPWRYLQPYAPTRGA
jgi:hypothetical protein